ncbi:protein kinase [Glycocaulis profundi]|nr:protein kinase [Glycocaulis profundi]
MDGGRIGWPKVEALLDAALELPESEREAFVRAQAGDSGLEAEVMSLLGAAARAEDFLEGGGDADAALLASGEQIGAWRIDGIIGRGGMGDVYQAGRADGLYEQTAALKLMRAGSEDRAALFDSERRYLARLEHPNIARLLDGGVTGEGRPWMVMELAAGTPVDDWAAETKAGPRRIVEVMLQVCEALSHAHEKLIVHRDIKPSNILVDETGRARVIDFGVARLAGAEKRQAAPLSLDYAAPELLEGEAATTASDVYGLAATLYALLAGHPPLRLGSDPLPVAMRRAVEEVPPRLSLAMPTGMDGSLVRDIDRVLARALSKRPEDRYRTVSSLCEDLSRALEGRAVSARAGERGYVMGRFLRRHRWQTAAAAALVLSLAGGLTASLWQASEARIERDWALREQARLEAVQHYLYFMLRDGADASGGTGASAAEILDAAADQVTEMFSADPAQGAQVMHTLAELYFYLNDYEAAAPLLRRLAHAEDIDLAVQASARYDLAQVLLRMGDRESAGMLLEQAQAFWNQDPGQWRRRLVDSRLVEARLLRDSGELEAAVSLLQGTLPERVALSGHAHRMTGVFRNDLGVMLTAAGRMDEAAVAFRDALATWRATGLDHSPDALNTLNNLAAVEVLSGRHEAAAPLFGELLELRRSSYGPSATTAAVLNNYGKTLVNLDRPEEALPYLREAAEMAREHAGSASLVYASALAGHSEALAGTGEVRAALDLAESGFAEVVEAAGGRGPASSVVGVAWARTLAAQGETDRAAELLDEAEAAFAPLGAGAAPQMQAIATIRERHGL